MVSIEIIVRDDQGKIIRRVVDQQVILPELSLDGVEEAVELGVTKPPRTHQPAS